MNLVRAPLRLKVREMWLPGFYEGRNAAAGTRTLPNRDAYLGIRAFWRLQTEQATSNVEDKGGDATKNDSPLVRVSIPQFQSA